MNKLYPFILALSLILGTGFYLRSEDTIPATDLQELVVKSERSWIENGVFNFIPTKKEKQHSNSPGTLIRMMDIPFLRGDGDAVKTLAEEPVTIFINGEPANDIDLSTFWPSEVKKVEYMQNPSDPRFRGARNVVNFVMQRYEVGGVTRIYARQDLPMTNGFYDVASKLSYKKMTYGLSVNSSSLMWNGSESEDVSTYKDIFYRGKRHDAIQQSETSKSDSEFWKTTIAANGRYTSSRFTTTHTVGLIWTHAPGSKSESSSRWTYDLFGSDHSSYFDKSDSYSPFLRGEYYGSVSDLFTISGGWSYIYSDNSRFFSSQLGETPVIENDFVEKVHSLPIDLRFSYRPDAKLTLLLGLSPRSRWFESSYTGSVHTRSRQFREDFQTTLTAYWNLSDKLILTLEPGILFNYYKIDDTENRYTTPTCDFNIDWYPKRNLNVSGSLTFFQNSLSAGASNPVVYRKDELTWISGNPDLKPESSWIAGIKVYYSPASWLRLSSYFTLILSENSSYGYIEGAPEDMGGVLEIQRNCGRSEDYRILPSISISLFKRKLSLSFYPKFSYKKTNGGYYSSVTCFQPIGDIRYMIGNFNVEAKYEGKRKYLVDESGNEIAYQPDNVSLGVSYGWRNLYVYCGIEDLFHTKYRSSSYAYSDVLTKESTSWTTGRRFKINLTYTFGYGKKLDQNINISSPGGSDSSIL